MIMGVPYDAEIEYLEATGTQWIDTGYKPNTDTQIECLLCGDYNNKRVFGAREAFGKKQCEAILYDSSYGLILRLGSTTGQSQITYRPPDPNATLKVVLDKTGATINNVFTAFSDGIGPDFQASVDLLLFAGNSNGTPADCATVKIWYCKIVDNGTLVRDLIPVRVGQVGYMYDRVSRKLFGNAGTGAFVLGPDVATPVMGLRRYQQIGGAA